MYLFLERGKGREKEREKHPCVRETLMGCLLYVPQLGIEPQPSYVCPEQELNPQHFGVQDNDPTN